MYSVNTRQSQTRLSAGTYRDESGKGDVALSSEQTITPPAVIGEREQDFESRLH
jgi:hypothetical protein